MAKVKIPCVMRCPVAGVVYLPPEVEVDAEVAEMLQRLWPTAFPKVGGGTSSVEAGGEGIDADAPAPEKRRKKPAKYKRKG